MERFTNVIPRKRARAKGGMGYHGACTARDARATEATGGTRVGHTGRMPVLRVSPAAGRW